ncbi:succinate dehydrogenase assembly factor 4, mitochondrial-like [Planococcus citri]|uniref:succinate dehydrogenase assembly factor 4, mitochondrial-like n=1 Tax=Planococcus citri TaxID=170843 RepID=UPI0031F7409A
MSLLFRNITPRLLYNVASLKYSSKPPDQKCGFETAKKIQQKTPIDKIESQKPESHGESDPLPPWPDNTNPNTGEVGGPRGPEPTRFGDWERKGRVTDF